MLTILNSESLWIVTDMIQFNAIRDILDREKIKYKYKTYNHLGEWAGSGTLRGNFGSVGNPTSQSIQYEIFVARKDLEMIGLVSISDVLKALNVYGNNNLFP